MSNAMNTTIATAGIATLGTWANGKGVSQKIIISGAVLALGIAALDSASPEFAQQFALLLLVVALFTYALPILNKLGLVEKGKGKK